MDHSGLKVSIFTFNNLFPCVQDFPDYLEVATACFCVELVNLLPVHQYSVDIFSCSGPSGILGSGRKQNIV